MRTTLKRMLVFVIALTIVLCCVPVTSYASKKKIVKYSDGSRVEIEKGAMVDDSKTFVTETKFDKKGIKLSSTTTYDDGSKNVYTYYKTGRIKAMVFYDENGVITSSYEYYSDGKVKQSYSPNRAVKYNKNGILQQAKNTDDDGNVSIRINTFDKSGRKIIKQVTKCTINYPIGDTLRKGKWHTLKEKTLYKITVPASSYLVLETTGTSYYSPEFYKMTGKNTYNKLITSSGSAQGKTYAYVPKGTFYLRGHNGKLRFSSVKIPLVKNTTKAKALKLEKNKRVLPNSPEDKHIIGNYTWKWFKITLEQDQKIKIYKQSMGANSLTESPLTNIYDSNGRIVPSGNTFYTVSGSSISIGNKMNYTSTNTVKKGTYYIKYGYEETGLYYIWWN